MNLPLSEVDRQRGGVEKEQDPKVKRNSCRGFQKKSLKFIMFVTLFGQFLFVLLLVCNLCACLSSSSLFCCLFVFLCAWVSSSCLFCCLFAFLSLFEQLLFVLCLQSSLFRKISRGLPSRGEGSWRSWWEVSRLGSLRGGQPCFCFCLVVVALSRLGSLRGGQPWCCQDCCWRCVQILFLMLFLSRPGSLRGGQPCFLFVLFDFYDVLMLLLSNGYGAWVLRGGEPCCCINLCIFVHGYLAILTNGSFFRHPVVIISRDCCSCVQMFFLVLLLMSNLRSLRGHPCVCNTYIVIVFMLSCLLSFVVLWYSQSVHQVFDNLDT